MELTYNSFWGYESDERKAAVAAAKSQARTRSFTENLEWFTRTVDQDPLHSFAVPVTCAILSMADVLVGQPMGRTVEFFFAKSNLLLAVAYGLSLAIPSTALVAGVDRINEQAQTKRDMAAFLYSEGIK